MGAGYAWGPVSTPRAIHGYYVGPLDAVWLAAAARVGLGVVRSSEVYASTDGRGTLAIGSDDTLDPDDCLAQMILHELCHSLVQGPGSFAKPDFGLDNESDRDAVREHACLRVQASLAAAHGLRTFLAPTTDFRAFYDALGDDALAGAADDPSIPLARDALRRATEPPWAPHLERALSATAAIVEAARATDADDLPDPRGRSPIWGRSKG